MIRMDIERVLRRIGHDPDGIGHHPSGVADTLEAVGVGDDPAVGVIGQHHLMARRRRQIVFAQRIPLPAVTTLVHPHAGGTAAMMDGAGRRGALYFRSWTRDDKR